MTFYWLYSRLYVHVLADDETLMQSLDDYADAHIVGGRDSLTDAHRDGIRHEHADAADLYSGLVSGRL